MCLISYNVLPYIAFRNIPCYKLLYRASERCYVSPFQRLEYKINDFNYPKEKYINWGKDITMDEYSTFLKYNDYRKTLYMIEKGFLHSYTFKGTKSNDLKKYENQFIPNYYLFECYIPKGTEYFISVDENEFCSRKLFVTNNKVELK